jgi:hypothetical protein
LLGLVAVPFAACGPSKRPPEGCGGPSYNLVVTTESGPLPADTRIKVVYGSDQEGEPYALGQHARKQAVFCDEDTTQGGAPSTSDDEPAPRVEAGAAGAAGSSPEDGSNEGESVVWALRCRLYTQGPARLYVTATGYEPIDDKPLSFEGTDRCDVDVRVTLEPTKPDAGK